MIYSGFLIFGPIVTLLVRDSNYVTEELISIVLRRFRFWQNILGGLFFVVSGWTLRRCSRTAILLGVATFVCYSLSSVAYGVIVASEWRWEHIYRNNLMLLVVGVGVLTFTYYYGVRKH